MAKNYGMTPLSQSQGAQNYKAFLDGLDDAKRKKELADLELAGVILGTVAYLRYRNAKKAK